jgi:lactate dehydrogenase-like 2-hydroxyacid dehydrogenase
MNLGATMTIDVLQTGAMPSGRMLGAPFALHHFAADAPPLDPELARNIRAIVASGPRPISAALIDNLPNLQVIANFGVGYDRVDVAAASRRGIVVTNTPDVLTEEVADFTLGLMIATVRRITAADAFVRSGKWEKGGFPLSPTLRGRRIGLLGMGRIGSAIARRCTGMGLEVCYHSRTRNPQVDHVWHPTVIDLARAADVLIVIVPGSAETEGLVDEAVLQALGPDGVLINVARGKVLDEAALIAALTARTILAAGLDVFSDEPRVPEALRTLDNVVLTPHVGSATGPTRDAMGDLVLDNIRSWFETGAALNPVNLRDLAPI